MSNLKTPETAEVLSANPEAVNVNVKVAPKTSPTGLPTHVKLAHVLALFVAGVIALCVSAVLADGTSVIILKHAKDLPRATNKTLKKQGLDYRLDELLGPGYGVGLHHDQAGYTWTETGAESTLKHLIEQLGLPAVIAAVPSVISTDGLKHPVHFLSCNKLEQVGLSAMAFGFIAEIVAVLMVLFHALALAGMLPAKPAKAIAVLVWFVLSAGFMIVCGLAMGAYTEEWTCDQPIIPKLKLSDHFDFNYGFGFAIIGYLSSVLILCVTLVFTSTTDGQENQPKVGTMHAVKTLCGVLTGIVTGVVISMLVLGPIGAFDSEKSADPNVNPCQDQKPYHAGPGDKYFSNTECFKETVVQTLEQAGANVTRGYVGGFDAKDRVPITKKYSEVGMCPVNVHWHLGAEHLSVGQYDDHGKGPHHGDNHRQLAADARLGFQCHHYNEKDPKFTKPYAWEHCTNMEVGETYEVHWPHSAAGACGTDWQMQTPFYDGVFCRDGIISIAPLNTYEKIGVQAQIFTIVNDETYYADDMISGMIVDGDKGTDLGIYTGSTTGTTRNNEICSRYTPITWQVDRKCHMISASSFDKMCKDMLAVKDDMSGDVYPHGARELVDHFLSANNQQTRKK
jgi:hypothetical protein